jgi:pimeloyl-ACP methyl ester carboxylesterase
VSRHTLFIAAIVLSVLPLLGCNRATEAESRESSVLTGGPRHQFVRAADLETLKSRLDLRTEEEPGTGLRISRGTFAVHEDREARSGRMIHLGVVILHAKGPNLKPDPVFPFAGGPGQDVTTAEAGYRGSWMRDERDIVLVAQRGTGGDNKLDCPKAADDGNIQGYLDPLFRTDLFRDCREELSKKFDLTKYSTELAADDVNDLRRALGYDAINVTGSSYGTRMALVTMRRHPETVRTAVLNGVAPIAFRNPLYHAPNFHEAIRALFAECANDPGCRAAFPHLEDEYLAILHRLEQEPAEVTVAHPVTHKPVGVRLSKEGFLEGLRVSMYGGSRSRDVPYALHRAFEGELRPFAELALESERGIRKILALGMLLCVTCAEDLDRITEEDIVAIAAPTDAGDARVRGQKAVCELWPRSDLDPGCGDPVSVEVPTLLFSGNLDPVTPPKWGAEAASHLPRSLHLIFPGSHGVGGPCLTSIQKAFLESGSVDGLDVSCTESLRPRKFRVSARR